jgi:hypothetical protein
LELQRSLERRKRPGRYPCAKRRGAVLNWHRRHDPSGCRPDRRGYFPQWQHKHHAGLPDGRRCAVAHRQRVASGESRNGTIAYWWKGLGVWGVPSGNKYRLDIVSEVPGANTSTVIRIDWQDGTREQVIGPQSLRHHYAVADTYAPLVSIAEMLGDGLATANPDDTVTFTFTGGVDVRDWQQTTLEVLTAGGTWVAAGAVAAVGSDGDSLQFLPPAGGWGSLAAGMAWRLSGAPACYMGVTSGSLG